MEDYVELPVYWRGAGLTSVVIFFSVQNTSLARSQNVKHRNLISKTVGIYYYAYLLDGRHPEGPRLRCGAGLYLKWLPQRNSGLAFRAGMARSWWRFCHTRGKHIPEDHRGRNIVNKRRELPMYAVLINNPHGGLIIYETGAGVDYPEVWGPDLVDVFARVRYEPKHELKNAIETTGHKIEDVKKMWDFRHDEYFCH
jgi:hypothetical protein